MRRVLAVVFAVVAFGAIATGAASSASSRQAQKQVSITVRFIQQATYQYPQAAIAKYTGGNVDKFILKLVDDPTAIPAWIPTAPTPAVVLATQLRLYAVGTVLGFPNGTYLGTMRFVYQLHGACGTSAAGCSGTVNIETLTTFPGGSIVAGGAQLSLSKGLVVPVTSGTGTFKGATGEIDVAPELDTASSVYHLSLPG